MKYGEKPKTCSVCELKRKKMVRVTQAFDDTVVFKIGWICIPCLLIRMGVYTPSTKRFNVAKSMERYRDDAD